MRPTRMDKGRAAAGRLAVARAGWSRISLDGRLLEGPRPAIVARVHGSGGSLGWSRERQGCARRALDLLAAASRVR